MSEIQTQSDLAVFTSHREAAREDRIRGPIALLRTKGCEHFRLTNVIGGIWIEGWKVAPRVTAEFNKAHVERVRVIPEHDDAD